MVKLSFSVFWNCSRFGKRNTPPRRPVFRITRWEITITPDFGHAILGRRTAEAGVKTLYANQKVVTFSLPELNCL